MRGWSSIGANAPLPQKTALHRRDRPLPETGALRFRMMAMTAIGTPRLSPEAAGRAT